MPDIFDQSSDVSRKQLCSFAGRLPEATAVRVLKIAAEHTTSQGAYAWPEAMMFPTATAEDTLLSRAYFNCQRQKLAAEVAEAVDRQLGAAEALFGIHEDFSPRPIVKTASESSAELLPGRYSVSGAAGLKAAGEEFQTKYARLNVEDRLEFAGNFVKTAEDWGVSEDLPDMVRIYAGYADTDKNTLCDQLLMRKAACQRSGKDGCLYNMLAEQLKEADVEKSSFIEKVALADAIHQLDDALGFTAPAYDRRMPDAYRIVFNKEAEDAAAALPEAQTLTKADIVARYGEGVLDEVEDDSGKLIPEAVQRIMNLFGTGGKA